MKLKLKGNWTINFCIFLFTIVLSVIFFGYEYPSSNNWIEIPPIISLINPNLYNNDYVVQEFLTITPRFFYQKIIYLTASLGLDLSMVYFIYYLIAFSSFTLGLYALGQRFGKSKLSGGILTFLVLFGNNATVGKVSLFRTEPIPAIFAMGLVIWGFYYCFCQRWILGYFFFGLGCILQFLIGILSGGLMAPLLFLYAKRNKNFKTLIFAFLTLGLFACLIYLPMVIAGNTGSNLISDEDFVYIYGYIRHPHHIILSLFSLLDWIDFIFFIIAGFLYIQVTNSLTSQEKLNFIIIIGSSIFALLLGYIFVEILPLSLFAKLQLARTTPFTKLIILIVISVLVDEHYRKGNFIICLLLILCPLLENASILVLILAVFLKKFQNTNVLKAIKTKTAIWISLVLLSAIFIIYTSPRLVFIFLIPFFVEEFLGFGTKVKAIIYSLAGISSMFLILGLFEVLPPNLSNLIQSRIQIYNQDNNDDLTKLALQFRHGSREDALILIPPALTQFRFFSQRSVFFDFRSFPYTDEGIQEWQKRLNIFVKNPKLPLKFKELDGYYYELSSSELLEIAQKSNVDYILTRTNQHQDIQKNIFLRQGPWIIYEINQKSYSHQVN